jgi:tetraacyldisaccharide 4'-kinase
LVLTPVYWVIVSLRNKKYDLLVTPQRGAARIVSIGNLGVGGTGKTPLCLWLLKRALKTEMKVAIFLRGYGSKNGVSDEAELYKEVLGTEHVYVNPSRCESLRKAEKQGYDLILMDDAFQHRKVHRDLDLVLSDATHFILDDSIMPLGTLREPISGLKRAQALVMTRCENQTVDQLQNKKKRLQQRFPHLYLVLAKTEVSQIVPLHNASPFQYQQKVFLFSGIGDPEKFRTSVKNQNIEVVGEKVFRDHHFITDEEIQQLEKQAISCGAEAFMTTAKDAVKIKSKANLPMYVLHIEFSIDEEQHFFEFVTGL